MSLIAWIDFETTGLDETNDCILEWGMVLTLNDSGFKTVARKNWIIRPDDIDYAEKRMQNGDGYAWRTHNGNGLWPLCVKSGVSLKKAEAEAVSLCKMYNPKGGQRVTLAGSGVAHFDHKFLLKQAPSFSAMLNYWTLDVGCVRRLALVHGVRAPEEASDADLKTHRAIDDIDMHLAEARWFGRFFESGSQP